MYRRLRAIYFQKQTYLNMALIRLMRKCLEIFPKIFLIFDASFQMSIFPFYFNLEKKSVVLVVYNFRYLQITIYLRR